MLWGLGNPVSLLEKLQQSMNSYQMNGTIISPDRHLVHCGKFHRSGSCSEVPFSFSFIREGGNQFFIRILQMKIIKRNFEMRGITCFPRRASYKDNNFCCKFTLVWHAGTCRVY